MRKSIFATLLPFALLIAAPAFADCAGDVKHAEMAVMEAKDANQKAMATKELDMAKKAMADKMDNECMSHAKMATDAAMKGGTMKDDMKK
ncbi:MAG TPA: hypothetical protein VMV26_14335 [Alphaproteobacteria bacterium]|jgi:hypothetical protein|nr:hypothetical protein [Alphaproteobacteria bacterium]